MDSTPREHTEVILDPAAMATVRGVAEAAREPLRDALVKRLDLLIEAEGLIEQMSRWMSCALPSQETYGGSDYRRTDLQHRAFEWKERLRDA